MVTKDFIILVFNGKLNAIAETSRSMVFNGHGMPDVTIDVQEIQIKYAEDQTQ